MKILGVVAKLKMIIVRIETACQKQYMKNSSREWREMLSSALTDLANILENETTVSAYELHSSGLIQVNKVNVLPYQRQFCLNANFVLQKPELY